MNEKNNHKNKKIGRRNFIKTSILGSTLIGTGANVILTDKSNAEISKLNYNTRSVKLREGEAPNILMIMADQWRWDYVGCAGADFVNTPAVDRLAGQGLWFSHYH